jgi:hypothetical protein
VIAMRSAADNGDLRPVNKAWLWLGSPFGLTLLVLAVLAVPFGLIYASYLPHKLGPGDFPASFHESLEAALPARLPSSTVFTRAIWFHGAGDVSIWVAAKVPHEEIESLKDQFAKSDTKYSWAPLQGAEYVLGRTLEDQDVEFAGSFKWGECAILPDVDGWHEVLFHTENRRPGQADSSKALNDHFRWPGT